MPLFEWLFAGVITLITAALPMMLSGMIPHAKQRWAAAIFALLGALIFAGYINAAAPTPYAIGLGIGFIIATVKLTFGIRLL
ncbi:hypothetical protein [Erythrobacter aureus]|uniref:Uncharacterized protein n=1 Tax=Erythrobacter aureus TaxID=2182384 RepID=A0A345YIG4_9SPHN|nr:hypothetical protein [Erythrobacter aureus]AXK43716.1 hypothetical protein DVR09_14760 [Erythrobacter aureus]